MRASNIAENASGLTASDYPNISFVSADEGDWNIPRPSQTAWPMFLLETIRRFETALLRLDEQKLIHGPLHSSIGEEAVAVGATLALSLSDKVISTHRAHHHFLAKAMDYYASPEFDPLTSGPDSSLVRCVRRTMSEVLGLKDGWCGGRGGSMHLYDRASGNVGTNAIVGGGVPIASGAAFAEKLRGSGAVALCYLGDGAVSIGSFHEGVNMAVIYKLPAIFVIENNLYAVATNNEESTGLTDLAIRACGYNIPGIIVDGMDVLAMKRAVEVAREQAAEGHGPVIIEAKTYRYCHQSGSLPGSAYGYRTKEEEASWLEKDPLNVFPKELRGRGILTDEQLKHIAEAAEELVQDAINYCTESNGQGVRVTKTEMWPRGSSVATGLRSDGREFDDAKYSKLSDYSPTKPVKMAQAISAVLARRMETDPEVFTLGEEVGHLGGGAYGATKDALALFPDRVLNTPITEAGFTGLAHGAAMAGLKPVIDIMFPDFVLVAADQFFNQIGMARHMYGGGVDVPLVMRTRSSAGRGFGAQHSNDGVGLFALYPGWRILAPTTPFDYIGMFNSALRSLDPVMIIEHHELYQMSGPIPENDLDYFVPMGKAEVRRKGSDVTVITYLSMSPRVLKIAEHLASEGVEVEIIDLRTLDHAHMDFNMIGESVAKTGSVVVVEQASSSQSLGHFIASQVQNRFFDHLDHPVLLANSLDVPVPVSKPLESACLVSDETIRSAILTSARRNSL